jgi:hypothetical protein
MLVVETDGAIPAAVIGQMSALPPVFRVLYIPSLEGL